MGVRSSTSLHHIFTPKSEILRNYVHSINIRTENCDPVKYQAFPQDGVAIGFFESSSVEQIGNQFNIDHGPKGRHQVVCIGKLLNSIFVEYRDPVFKISMHIKEACVNYFIPGYFESYGQSPIQVHNMQDFNFDLECDRLFSGDLESRVAYLEEHLLSALSLNDPMVIRQAVEKIKLDPNTSVEELLEVIPMSKKTLYRHFKRHVGCSIAEYKRLVKFRQSLSYHFESEAEQITDLCYEGGYFDPSHLCKEVKRFTGKNPKSFFDEVQETDVPNQVYIVD